MHEQKNVIHVPRKRFGQHFLTDLSVVQRIIDAVNIQETDHILEIGPGGGVLTERILNQGCLLDAVELDRDLIHTLSHRFKDVRRFKLHQADILKFDLASISSDGSKDLRIVGNLPYNISTPLIFKLMEDSKNIKDMHFMLQKDMIKRMTTEHGSKAWGRLTVMLQYLCKTEYLFDVSSESFFPPPKVESAIIRLIPYKIRPYEAKNYERFQYLVRKVFSMRRKTLRNSLKGIMDPLEIEKIGLSSNIRPEQMNISDFIKLSNSMQ